jgi:hypothetical protein
MLIACCGQVGTITEYHFSIVQCMASLSWTIHSATAVILEDSILQDSVMKTWRGIAVLCLQSLTFATYIPEGHEYWMESHGSPVACIWRDMSGHYDPTSRNFWSMVVYLASILIGMARTLYAYFPGLWGWISDNVVIRTIRSTVISFILLPRNAHATLADRAQRNIWDTCLEAVLRVIATFVFVVTEILWSEAFGMQRRWMILVNNIYYTFLLRQSAVDHGREGDEDSWGFGQVVAILLLFLPLMVILETGFGA